MKKLLFTLAITLGTLATYAQATKLTVRNSSTSVIRVTMSVANSSCVQVASSSMAIDIQPGTLEIIQPLTNTASDNWYNVRAMTVPSGVFVTTPPSSVSTFNTCITSCTLPSDVSNGLSAIWATPCNDEVTIF